MRQVARSKELEEAVNDLVLRILHRGRLNQQELEGKIGVRDGGINMAKIHFVQEILTLAKTEAIWLADKLIGKDVEVRTEYNDIMDEEAQPREDDEAVSNFQARQRLLLAEYQNPTPPVEQLDIPIPNKVPRTDDNPLNDMQRVDRNKPALKLMDVPGTEELSENEA